MTTTETHLPSAIFRTWEKRIASGVLRTSLVRQYAGAIVPIAEGEKPHGFRTNLIQVEARDLVTQLRAGGDIRLPADDEAAGQRWLARNGHRIGLPAEATDLFDHFSYEGDVYGYGTRHTNGIMPVWRIHLTDGRQIDYANPSWQAVAWSGAEPFWMWRNDEVLR